MSADFTTTLEIKGTKEECLEIMKVLCNYATTDRQNHYRENRDSWYLYEDFETPEEEVERRWKTGEMNLMISGPYGMWNPIDGNCDLFERLADASPGAWFRGSIEGFDAGGDVSIAAELIDGLLYYRLGYSPFDSYDEEFDEEFDEEDEEEEEKYCEAENPDEDDESYKEEIWDGFYDPKTREYHNISLASEGDSVTVSIVLTDTQGVRHELILRSKNIERPLNFKCFPKDLLEADQTEKLIQLLKKSVNFLAGGETEEVRQKISTFGEEFQSAAPDRKPVRLELTKIHNHKAPFFFGWLRYCEPELKKLAKKVCTCAEKNKQRNIDEFGRYLENYEPRFPDCEYTGWPEFCGFGFSIPSKGGGFSWNPDTKATFDWHGVAGSVEEFAKYLCSKKEPREYAVEKVIVDYVAGTPEQTAVYMPGGPEIKTASE